MIAVALTLAALAALLAPGYVARLRAQPGEEAEEDGRALPAIDVLVPVLDEAGTIGAKIANLRSLDYPPDRLRVWLCEGASRDGTSAAVRAAVGDDPRFRRLTVPLRDKTGQLNAALRRASAPWVLVTDADARLPRGALRALVAAAGKGVAVVGATVEPAGAHPVEALYWRASNRLRLRESRGGAAPIVFGPAYLFHRSLLDRFPDDVVADDVHVALLAAAAGGRTRVLPLAVREDRSPACLHDLWRHKLRKCDAYLHEVLRFLPLAGGMPRAARIAFLWRAAQLLVAPPLALAGAAAAMAAPEAGAVGIVVSAACGAAGLAVVTREAVPPGRALLLVALVLSVLVAAWLRYPFSRRGGALERFGDRLGAAA